MILCWLVHTLQFKAHAQLLVLFAKLHSSWADPTNARGKGFFWHSPERSGYGMFINFIAKRGEATLLETE